LERVQTVEMVDGNARDRLRLGKAQVHGDAAAANAE
jgi:hypothetical protein